MITRNLRLHCKFPKYRKNTYIHNGQQKHQCKNCRLQFVDCFVQALVSDETGDLIDCLELECRSLQSMCRAVKVGFKWLLSFLANYYETLADYRHVQPISWDRDARI